MSPEAQRIAIAEACGWKHIHLYYSELYGENRLAGYAPDDPDDATQIREYLSDLNAMHEAEKVLDWDEQASCQLFNYRCYLTKICGSDKDLIFHASATQRAEAFLRAIGKWENAK